MSPDTDIRVTVEGLKPLQALLAIAPELVTQETKKAMDQARLTLEAEAKRLVPVKTGHLRRSITSETRPLNGGVVGIVGTNVKYASFVEFGTGIYGPEKKPIAPVTKKALAWGKVLGHTAAGAPVKEFVRRSVKGMRPRPYLRRAFEEKKGVVEGFFKAALQRVLRRLASGG